jgi:uncharacterized membrane protein
MVSYHAYGFPRINQSTMYYGGEIFFVIAAVLFFVGFMQISNLRKELEELKGAKKSSSMPVANEYKKKRSSMPVEKREPGAMENLFAWMKEDFLMKLGAGLVLLALAWFVTYSFQNDWIGPMGRIALGMLAGTGVLAGGYFAMEKRRVPGQVLIVLGTTGLLLTTFAARGIYDFFTPASALGIMTLVVVLTTVISVKEKAMSLAVTSFLGGVAAPLMTASPDPNYLVLVSYLFLLCLGVFAVVAMRGWKELVTMAVVTVAIFTLPAELLDELSAQMALLFAALFYALFFVGNSLGILHDKKVVVSDLIVTLFTVFLGIFWVSEYVLIDLQSLVLAAVAIISMAVSLLFKSRTMPIKSIYLHSAGAVVLLGAAAIFEFEGEIQTIVLSLEALAFVAMAIYLLKDRVATLAAGTLHVIPFLLALDSVFSGWHGNIIGLDLFTLMTVTLSLLITAYLLREFARENKNDERLLQSSLFSISSSVFFSFAIIWRVLEGLMTTDYAHGTALVIYSLVGLALLFKGMVQHLKTFKWTGTLILGLVLLRLLFVEIWSMSLVERIITFVVIGALFITTAFFEKKSK